jgi:hypothetical protein
MTGKSSFDRSYVCSYDRFYPIVFKLTVSEIVYLTPVTALWRDVKLVNDYDDAALVFDSTL